MEAKSPAQGGLRDLQFDAPDIVAKLEEAEEHREAHKKFLQLNKAAKEAIAALAVEVPEGQEVRIALIGDEVTYGVRLSHHGESTVDFVRSAGVRIGRPKRSEG